MYVTKLSTKSFIGNTANAVVEFFHSDYCTGYEAVDKNGNTSQRGTDQTATNGSSKEEVTTTAPSATATKAAK